MAKTAKQNRGKTLRRIKKGIAKASKRFVKNVKQLSARGRNILGRAKKMKIWGGWKPNTPTRTDTNEILNRYYAKYSKTSGKKVFEKLNEIPSDGKKRVLYVIDMQNDFIDEPSPELTGVPVIDEDGNILGHIGAFSVNNGGKILLNGINGEPGLIAFLDNNINNFEKIIFSRDLHDPNHCSFGTVGGTFPPHCVIGTYGSGFHPALNKWLSQKKELFGKKIDIIFKGMHPNKDSFGAEAYAGDIGNKRQIGNKCCGSTMFDSKHSESCSESIDTGSYILSSDSKIDPLGNDMGGTTWEKIKSNFVKYDAPKAGEYYVCGLAGDFCVRDTALNLKDNHNKSSVYVLHDFTRNAFVPLSVPLMSSVLSTDRYGEGLNVSHLEKNDTGKLAPIMAEEGEEGKKGLHHYIFKFAPPSTYTILGKNEAENVVGNNHNFIMDYKKGLDANGKVIDSEALFGAGLQFFHFVSDHRQIIDDYEKAGIKLFTIDNRLSDLQIDAF
jgi:nicotinamidase-related amidase